MEFKTVAVVMLSLMLATCDVNVKTGKHDVEYLQTEEFAALNYPFSEAVRVRNMLYLSGQIGTLPNSSELISGGMGPETNKTWEIIRMSWRNMALQWTRL